MIPSLGLPTTQELSRTGCLVAPAMLLRAGRTTLWIARVARSVFSSFQDHFLSDSTGQFKVSVSAGWLSSVGAGAMNLSPPGAG